MPSLMRTVDVAVKLGVDPRHADQMVRVRCSAERLGKNVRVLVFAKVRREKKPGCRRITLVQMIWWPKFRRAGLSLIPP